MRKTPPSLPTDADYHGFAQDALDRLLRLNGRLAAGKVDVDAWQDAFHAILFDGHSDAWALGRRLAGVPGDRDDDDERFGLDAADGQDGFLSDFAAAFRAKDPRYFDAEGAFRADLVQDRTTQYVARMRGTANEAFVQASDPEDEFDWVLGASEHCPDCVELAAIGAASPYTPSTMISHPGDGQTECRANCHCRLVRRRDGLSGFARPDIYRLSGQDP